MSGPASATSADDMDLEQSEEFKNAEIHAISVFVEKRNLEMS